MTIEELRSLFSDMLSKDMRPMLCDTEVPLYDASVPCGNPTLCPDDFVETVLLPKELLSIHPEFVVTVKGDSMKDAGIESGDAVKVMGDTKPYDGDIVLASIDGEYTLKTYFEDEEGRIWLVPQNEEYVPILLDGSKPVKIYGKVKEIMKTAHRVPTKLCAKAVKRALKAKEVKPKISEERVSCAFREMSQVIKVARLWYAVYRMMADYSVVEVEDFDTFIDKLKAEVPHHEHIPARAEMQRMATLSFAKPVKQWSADNAPVKGKRYKNYVMIAKKTEELLLSK
ncbi:S24 family peptidase [uncultured Prevotella sp.]|uniref:LexA family protein n=1 Tax=uncultured Prevotella sp. TaxID=159272 RepID=UPI002590C917|nr:S24 family peptidase [uncultured Prevotella sp.]